MKNLIKKLKALCIYAVSSSCEHSFYMYGIRYGKNLYRCSHCGKEKAITANYWLTAMPLSIYKKIKRQKQ